MLDGTLLQSILDELEKNGDKFKSIFDKFLKFAIGIIQSTEELREEIGEEFEIFQTYITDMEIQYWFQVGDGNISYGQGIHESPSVEIWMTKEMILQVLKGDLMGTEAYMKGILKARGSLTQGLRYIRLYRLFFEYMKRKHQLKGFTG